MLERVAADVEKFEAQIVEIQEAKKELLEKLTQLEQREAEIAPVHSYARSLMDELQRKKRTEAATAARRRKAAGQDPNVAAE